MPPFVRLKAAKIESLIEDTQSCFDGSLYILYTGLAVYLVADTNAAQSPVIPNEKVVRCFNLMLCALRYFCVTLPNKHYITLQVI